MPPRTLFASTLGIIQLAIQPKFGCPDGEAHFYNDETVNGTNLFFERTVQPKEDERAAFRLRSNLTKYSASLQASYDQKNCQKFANYIVEEKLAISNAAMTVQNPPNQHPSSDSDPSQNGGAHDNNDSEADQEEPVSMKEDAVEPQSYLQTCNNGTNVANHQQIEGVLADVNEVAVELRNYPVKDSNFLSTDHIDYFIELLRTIGNPSYSFCQVNSTVSSTLVMQNEPDFDEFARHCTPFDDETRFCFLPLCRNEHWTLVVLDRVFWSVTHYDPLIRHNTGNTSTVRFGQEVFQRIFGISCRPQISPVILPDSWVQKDSFNCGVYVSRFMERIAMHGQDWQNEPHQLDIKTERRRMQLIFDEIAHTKRYPSQWRTGSITMASNNAQTEVPVQSKIPNPIQASSIPSPLSKRQSSFFNMPDINGAAKVNVDPVSSDINRDCEMIDMTVTPSKQCRLSKRKGTRKLSQATKLKMKRNASQLHYKRLKVASQSNQIAVDNALMDLATLSVQDNVLQGSSVSDTITSKQASLRLKRKKPTQGALATPSPVIRKRPSTYNENVIAPDDLHENSNNTEADDIDLARENIFIFADDDEPSNLTANDLPFQATQTSACLQVNPSESDCCDKSLNENTFEHYNHFEDDVIDSDNEHQNDYQNDGMRLDMEIALKKPQSSEEFEHDEILDDDHEPTYVEADANYDVDELPVNPFDIGTAFSMNDIITPHPTYRNDSEMVGFLTAMAYFAVKEGGHWRSIGILDSSICELQTLAAPIKNYMRGYYENPELILHPAFSRGCSGTDVGHWFLIAIDVTRYNMTVYDSLLDPSYQNDKDKVLPDPRYIEYANKVCDRLIQGKLIVRRPSYIRHRPHSYNKQEDGANCGVHVARIAEELAFNGTTHELYPFNIKAELHRMWKTCREIHFEEGLPKAWPQTCQAAAFPLVDEDTHAIQRLPKPIKLQKKAKKKVLKPLKEEHLPASTVPLKSEPRRSARLSTKQLTKEIDNIIFDQQQRQDTKKSGIPLARLSANFIPEPCSFGKMDKICQYCGARLFWAETTVSTSYGGSFQRP
uniref:ATP-dependent DNA helicase n=1 Tax=Panagrellus redivivus TaxID=6233 RepID=A0A7E4VPJ0_PANRE